MRFFYDFGRCSLTLGCLTDCNGCAATGACGWRLPLGVKLKLMFPFIHLVTDPQITANVPSCRKRQHITAAITTLALYLDPFLSVSPCGEPPTRCDQTRASLCQIHVRWGGGCSVRRQPPHRTRFLVPTSTRPGNPRALRRCKCICPMDTHSHAPTAAYPSARLPPRPRTSTRPTGTAGPESAPTGAPPGARL